MVTELLLLLVACVIATLVAVILWIFHKKNIPFPTQWYNLRTKFNWSYTEDENGETPPAYEGRSSDIFLQPESGYRLSGTMYTGIHPTFNLKLNGHTYGVIFRVVCLNMFRQLATGKVIGSTVLMRDFTSSQLSELLKPLEGKSGTVSFEAGTVCVPDGHTKYTVTLDIEVRSKGDQFIRSVTVTSDAESFFNWVKWFNVH